MASAGAGLDVTDLDTIDRGGPDPGTVACGAERLAVLIDKTGVGPPVPAFADR